MPFISDAQRCCFFVSLPFSICHLWFQRNSMAGFNFFFHLKLECVSRTLLSEYTLFTLAFSLMVFFFADEQTIINVIFDRTCTRFTEQPDFKYKNNVIDIEEMNFYWTKRRLMLDNSMRCGCFSQIFEINFRKMIRFISEKFECLLILMISFIYLRKVKMIIQ